MLHEILFALWGFPGDVFLLTRHGIELAKGFADLHPSEIEFLNRLCQIGTIYKSICDFTGSGAGRQNKDTSVILPNRPQTGSQTNDGLYRTVFRRVLDRELDDYRHTLLNLERHVILHPDTPLSYIAQKVEVHRIQLLELHRLQNRVVSDEVHGTRVLVVLEDAVAKAIPHVRGSMLRMQHQCQQILLRQLTNWMVYGLLADADGEFFIRRIERKGESLVEADGVGKAKTNMAEGWRSFELSLDLLPSSIRLPVAEQILFVGKTVNVVFSPDHKMSTWGGKIPKEDEETFLQLFASLRSMDELRPKEFEAAIEAMRSRMAYHMWSLLMENDLALQHIALAKGMFLLGNCEFFVQLMAKLPTGGGGIPLPFSTSDIGLAFKSTVADSHTDDLIRLLSLSSPRPSAESSDAVPPLSPLGRSVLTYAAEWPMNLIFTSEVLEKYGQIFEFLFAVFQAQVILSQSWGSLRSFRSAKHGEGLEIWRLRMMMAQCVDSLYYYLQVDVVEMLYGPMVASVREARDFDRLRRIHADYLSNMQAQMFLHSRVILDRLRAIFGCSFEFCAIISNISSPIEESVVERVITVGKEFEKQCQLLYRVLGQIKNQHVICPRLPHLMLKIDYNGFFSKQLAKDRAARGLDPSKSMVEA